LEAEYTREKNDVDFVRAEIFKLVRNDYQKRDRLKLIIQYRREFLSKLISEGNEEAEEVAEEYTKAKSENDANYEQAFASTEDQEELTEYEKSKVNDVWKALVKLFHPDRFNNKPKTKAEFEKLVQVINRARDDADINFLEEIADDPEGYIDRQGWASLNFDDEGDLKKQRKFYEALELRIIAILNELNALRESPDYELMSLSKNNENFFKEVATKRIKSVRDEIVTLEEEAAILQREIVELADGEATQID
jgi:hypothetical protein